MAKFEKGQPRPANAGRKAGTPNKLSATVRERLEELGCDPIEGLAVIAMDEKNTPELRAKAYGDLAQYAFPKLKAVDHTFGGENTLNVNTTSGTELLTGRIASLATRRPVAPGDSGTN